MLLKPFHANVQHDTQTVIHVVLSTYHSSILHCKKSFAKFRCGQRWREPNDMGVGKFLLPRRLVLRHRCQHRSLVHSDMAFLQCVYVVTAFSFRNPWNLVFTGLEHQGYLSPSCTGSACLHTVLYSAVCYTNFHSIYHSTFTGSPYLQTYLLA
jgi:hypothetical protein